MRYGDAYTIEIPPPAAADDTAFVALLVGLVNDVYEGAEIGIWREGFRRTSLSEIEAFLRAGELAVAYVDGNSGSVNASRQPVGCVCIKILPSEQETIGGQKSPEGSAAKPGIGNFSMLSLDPAHRGSGVGRAMVHFVEEWCQSRLGLGVLGLELLFPIAEHAFKARLAAWYQRMGYAEIRDGVRGPRSFADDHPEFAPLLAGPCEYRIYEKKLA